MSKTASIFSVIGKIAVYWIITILLLNVIPIKLAAQATDKPISSPTNVDTAQVREILPIAIVDIPGQLQSATTDLRSLRLRIEKTATEIKIDTLIAKAYAKFHLLVNKYFTDSLTGANLNMLDEVMREFSQLKVTLTPWQEFLIQSQERLLSSEEALRTKRIQWEKTMAVNKDGLPDEILAWINTVLEEIETVSSLVMEQRAELLIKQDMVSKLILSVDESIEFIQSQFEETRKMIFKIDRPPLWSLVFASGDSVSFKQLFQSTIISDKEALRYFGKNFQGAIVLQFGVMILLFFLVFLAGERIKKWSVEQKDESMELSFFIVQRPFATALMIALLSTPIQYKHAPVVATDLIILLAVIPMVILLPGVVKKIPVKYIYLFSGLFLLSQTAGLLTQYYILDRFSLLILNLSTIFLFIYLIKTKDNFLSGMSGESRAFPLIISKIAIVVAIFSLVANLIGAVGLAKYLTNGLETTLFGGILIFLATKLLRSIFALLIHTDLSKGIRVVKNYPDQLQHSIFRIINIAGVLYWLYITLKSYRVFTAIWNWFVGLMSNEWSIGSVSMTLGNLVAFFVTLWLALFFSRIMRIFLQEEILDRMEMPRGIPGAISMVIRIILIGIGFVLAFGAAGIDLDNIAIIFGALGVGIGFGLQNIFNNLISGIILAFERPIQIGDIIQISSLNLMGEVREIGIRSSIVKTFDGAEVIVPNGNLISNEMVNWTLSDRRKRQEILIGVKYGTDLKKVLEILSEVVADHENVLKNPGPLIIFTGFGDSSLNFRVLFWTHIDFGLSTVSSVGIAIDEALKKKGIEIPFPQRDLHLKSTDSAIDVLLKSPVKSSMNTGNASMTKTNTASKTGESTRRGKKSSPENSDSKEID